MVGWLDGEVYIYGSVGGWIELMNYCLEKL